MPVHMNESNRGTLCDLRLGQPRRGRAEWLGHLYRGYMAICPAELLPGASPATGLSMLPSCQASSSASLRRLTSAPPNRALNPDRHRRVPNRSPATLTITSGASQGAGLPGSPIDRDGCMIGSNQSGDMETALKRRCISGKVRPRGTNAHDWRLERLIDRLRWRIRSPIRRLLQPSSFWIRMPAGALLTCGGLLGFLPILGFWMLPLGLILLAEDVPPLRSARAWVLDWIERRYPNWLSPPASPPTR